MLRKSIQLLLEDKVYSKRVFADQLSVSEKMAGQLLHELARQGYVKNIVPGSDSGSCNSCTCRCNFAKIPENRSTAWSLTEKGIEAAQSSKGCVDPTK